VAGESAREIARNRRAKAERLNRVADAYDKGADGEQRTAAALAMLPASGWFVLHDMRWPGRIFANIDHVVVGPGGVFVIDSKAWSGRVEVRDDVLRQNGRQRESAVAGAAEAAMAIAGVLHVNPVQVSPVLCFVGQAGLQGWARDVMLTTPENLVAMMLSRPPVLDDRAVRQAVLGLQRGLESARRTTPAPSRRRPAAHRPRTRPAKTRNSRLGGLMAFVATVLAMLFGVWALNSHAGDVAHGIVGLSTPAAAESHQHRLGQRVILPAAAHRPRLMIAVDRAVTVHRVGSTPYLLDGNRFFGVRLSIHNEGKRPWASEPGTAFEVTDSLNVPHSGGTAIRIREGRVLPDPIRVPPGGTVRGYVVFQLPATQPVTGISVTVGPGEPGSVIWRVERQ
jgi:hypothetical protein